MENHSKRTTWCGYTLASSSVVLKGAGRKLYQLWTGPYRVIKKFSDVVYCIQNTWSAKHRFVYLHRLKHCPKHMHLLAIAQRPPTNQSTTCAAPTPQEQIWSKLTSMTRIFSHDCELDVYWLKSCSLIFMIIMHVSVLLDQFFVS